MNPLPSAIFPPGSMRNGGGCDVIAAIASTSAVSPPQSRHTPGSGVTPSSRTPWRMYPEESTSSARFT